MKIWKGRFSPDTPSIEVGVDYRSASGEEGSGPFVLDTGSPVTILSRRAAALVGIRDAPRKPRSSLWAIGGSEVGFREVLPELVTLGASLRSVPVVVHDLPDDIAGVLGLDILRRGRLQLDLPWGLVEFEWRLAA